MTQILLSFIPMFVIIIIMFVFRIKIKKWFKFIIDTYFWGLMAIVMVAILGAILSFIFPTIYKLHEIGGSFLYYLIFAGFCEEISKFLSIKFSKPKTNKEIILNGVFIATFFSIIEHYSYLGAILSDENIFIRLLTPGHALYILFPIWGMILYNKNRDKKSLPYIGLLIGIIVHAIYDTLSINLFGAIVFGIIGYSAIIYSLYKASKMPDNEQDQTVVQPIINNIVNQESTMQIQEMNTYGQMEVGQTMQVQQPTITKEKDKFFIVKIIISILISLLFISTFNVDNKLIKMNNYCHHNQSNIDVKVTSAELTKENNAYDGETYQLLKVGVSIKNNSDSNYALNAYDFSIINVSNGESKFSFWKIKKADELEMTTLQPGSETSGYIYFEVDEKLNEYRFKHKTFLEQNDDECIFELNY